MKVALTALFLLAAASSSLQASQGSTARALSDTPTSCIQCHGPMSALGSRDGPARPPSNDVHESVGLSCHDCHGGNPDPALGRDEARAHDREFPGGRFAGTPDPRDVPGFCGRCHSDPAYMKRYTPNAHTDQEKEYWTSDHGRALKKGDVTAAQCVDCHGAHDMRRAADPRSPLHPARLADTCGVCHSDPARMQGRLTADGRPLPTDQLERWRGSVHGRALLVKGDLFSPTCNDCHGDHGATPRGIESLVSVCEHCHAREAALLHSSPKQEGFDRHNSSYVGEMGAEGCGSCHLAPEPQASLAPSIRLKQCITCHGDHRVARATLEIFPALPPTPCEVCHAGPEAAQGRPQGEIRAAKRYIEARDSLLAQAGSEGLSGGALYDWMVDRTLALPPHVQTAAPGGSEDAALRPEFRRLFNRLRIGKTHHPAAPDGKGLTSAPIVRCVNCHSPRPELSKGPVGLSTARTFMETRLELSALSARAQMLLLEAQRGGVEVGTAALDLKRSLDSQANLQVLVHTFSAAEGSPFIRERDEARHHLGDALTKADTALRELRGRRSGLLGWLALTAAALAGVALRRRQLARRLIEADRASGAARDHDAAS